METLSILVGVILCLVIIEGRHLENNDDTLLSDNENLHDVTKNHRSESRHRRRRWNNNYGYDYPSPGFQYIYPERRDYERNQPDYLPRIVKLLEEISSYVRRPAPPPQAIYVPYPVPYPVPQYTPCATNPQGTDKQSPNITNRWPDMEDPNMNWGVRQTDEDGPDVPNDGARPVSFDPIKPVRPLRRPAPKVEHGSFQASVGGQLTTGAPMFAEAAQPQPEKRNVGVCSAAILSCCADSNQLQCFQGFNCADSYDNGNACSQSAINAALESFKVAYAPTK